MVPTKPVNSSDTLLYNALNLLKDMRVLLINAVCKITPIIKDLPTAEEQKTRLVNIIHAAIQIRVCNCKHVGLLRTQ